MPRGRPKGAKNKATKEKEEKKTSEPKNEESKDQSNVQLSSAKKKPGRPKVNKPATLNDANANVNNSNRKYYNKNINHVYTELAKTSLGNTELYNLYGIVIDSTTPHRKDMNFKTHIKIIDPTFHLKNATSKEDSGFIQITFMAKSISQLPSFKRVGEIIRFHRANIGQYQGNKTFLVNMSYGSSWAIFEGMHREKDNRIENAEEDIDSSFDEQKLKKQSQKEKSEEAIHNFFRSKENHITISSGNKQGSNNENSMSSNSGEASMNVVVTQNYIPYKISSKDYSLGLVDRDIIKKYRTWMSSYFKNDFQYDQKMYIPLAKLRDMISNAQISGQELKIREYDLIVKIDEIKMTSSDDEENDSKKMATLIISDASCGDFELVVPMSVLPEKLQKGDVIRVSKSGPNKNQKKNALELSDSGATNIMVIDKQFKIAQRFHEKLVAQEFDITKLILGDTYTNFHNDFSHLYNQNEEVIEKPEIASTVGENFRKFERTELEDILYNNTSNQNKNIKLFRIRCYILNIQPLNLFEVCQLFCRQCFEAFSFKDFQTSPSSVYHCFQCGKEMNPIYKIQFLVKDHSLYKLQGAVKMLLYTMDGLCDKFFNGLPPQNLYKDQNARQRLEGYLKHIIRFNVFLDAIVERKVINDEVVLKLVNCRLKP